MALDLEKCTCSLISLYQITGAYLWMSALWKNITYANKIGDEEKRLHLNI